MSIAHILFQLFIGPLQLVFEATYTVAKILFSNSGLAIMVLSLAVNVLVLPLYKRADAIQEDERALQKRMESAVSHIKRTFSGDERMMVLQSYYRQNNYKPWYSLRASLPLLLQVPFFIAAFRFLSNLEELNGMSFGPIADLGAPDAMLTLAGLSINLLPILMTVINIVASAIYARGFNIKEKLQLYGMALIFLVLLYNSPAGLVFYWTLNNVFSLGKNIFQKLKNSGLIIDVSLALAGIGSGFYAVVMGDGKGLKIRIVLALLAVLLIIPMFKRISGLKLSVFKAGEKKPSASMYILGCLFLTTLSGLLIPSAVISVSPAEFIIPTDFLPPIYHVINALLLAAGCFIIWFGIFYYLADDKGKNIFAMVMWLLSGAAIVNYMFFGTELGLLTQRLKYEIYPTFSGTEMLINLGTLLCLLVFMALIWAKRQQLIRYVYVALCLSVFGMAALNISTIQKEMPLIRETVETESQSRANFTLTKSGENVVVIMLDRAFNCYVPYIFKESPEIAEQFDGFTYYPNTLSYSNCTLASVSSVFGGYEYAPEEINKRSDTALTEKHEEALLLLPELFNEEGYDVTMIDPAVDYTNAGNLSVFDDYPYIEAYNTQQGQFNLIKNLNTQEHLNNWQRNFFCYSVMKMSPLVLQNALYRYGTYMDPDRQDEVSQGADFTMPEQSNLFVYSYSFLQSLPEVSHVENESANRLVLMTNLLTHEASPLHMPDYDLLAGPNDEAFYREYYEENAETYTIDGRKLKMDNIYQIAHYQANFLSLKLLGQWFDYLRENGVYDNTRIILVSDHAHSLYLFDDTAIASDNGENSIADNMDLIHYNPLLMVKDFGSEGFTVDQTFMTNADVPLLATGNIIENPVNPFTQNSLTDSLKYADEHHVFCIRESNLQKHNETTYIPSKQFAVSGDIFDADNWRVMDVP